jgi:hypothetical protein
VIRMGLGAHRARAERGRSRWLPAAAAILALVAACQPSAPPGFTGSPPADGGSGQPGASVGAPDGSGLVAGKPTVTTDGGKVTVAGIGSGRTEEFELVAGSAEMTVSVCAANGVIPFVTLYDANDNKLGIIVEPTYTLANLAGGSYTLDVATNPACVWTIEVSPS